jgi:hypothetical protein
VEWLKRFRAVSAYLRQVQEFNRTTKGTRIAANRQSANAIYDRGGQQALGELVEHMLDMGRRDEKFLSDMKAHESGKK